VRLPVILALSLAVQAALVTAFWRVDALRRSRLQTTAGDVQRLDQQAQQRLREVEEKKRRQRENAELRREDGEKLAREEEREKTGEMAKKVGEMLRIREQMEEVEEIKLAEIRARTFQDVGLYFFHRLHPLATQLVQNARSQHQQMSLPAASGVRDAAGGFLALLESERDGLILPEALERVRRAHETTSAQQHEFIQQLDAAQAAYPTDEERIRNENHTEYLVNLARDQISEVLHIASAFPLENMNQPPPDTSGAESQPVSEGDLQNMSAEQLHATAYALHRDIQAGFTAARAADLAMKQVSSLADASARVTVPASSTPFSAGALPHPPATIAELNAYRAGLQQAEREVRGLWQQAKNMGRAGREMAGLEASSVPGGGAPGGGAARAALLSNAAQGDLGHFVDVTPFMRGGEGEGGAFGAFGGGRDITHKSVRTGFEGVSDAPLQAPPPARLSEEEVLAQALPGRKFSRTSPRTGWLYLDTWYVIGPWENEWRTGFDAPLPPETMIDLDAEYVGKHGQTLTWQFHQSDNIRVKPPRETEGATYYGYTEVYFEEGTEMLVAVASDDAAKVWINDTVIWQDRGFSPWRIDEGFRKVYFKPGFNTILLRIENGPITCTYSLLLCPSTQG